MALLYKLCKRGHEQRPESINWSIGTSGKPQRQCKECHKLAVFNGYQKRKAQKETENGNVVQ